MAGVRRISKATVAGVGLVARPGVQNDVSLKRGAALASALVEAATGPEIEAAATVGRDLGRATASCSGCVRLRPFPNRIPRRGRTLPCRGGCS